MLFLLVLKWNLSENTFFSVKTNANPHFAAELAEKSNSSFLLSPCRITFFRNLYSLIRDIRDFKWTQRDIFHDKIFVRWRRFGKYACVIALIPLCPVYLKFKMNSDETLFSFLNHFFSKAIFYVKCLDCN